MVKLPCCWIVKVDCRDILTIKFRFLNLQNHELFLTRERGSSCFKTYFFSYLHTLSNNYKSSLFQLQSDVEEKASVKSCVFCCRLFAHSLKDAFLFVAGKMRTWHLLDFLTWGVLAPKLSYSNKVYNCPKEAAGWWSFFKKCL